MQVSQENPLYIYTKTIVSGSVNNNVDFFSVIIYQLFAEDEVNNGE